MSRRIDSLHWDSDFFSVPIGRINTKKIDEGTIDLVLQEAVAAGIRCLYFEADPNDLPTVLTAEAHGFHLVDVRVVLEYPFTDRPAPSSRFVAPSELKINTARASDLPRLEEISEEVGEYSRYTFDDKFTKTQGKLLYRTWIRNSLSGLADIVLTARWGGEENDVIGLITCALKEGVSHIQLAGVHHSFRQKGVGTGLVQAALDWSKDQNVSKMQVVTQARNVPAQRLYQQMGFFTKTMTLYYHKWIDRA